MISQDAMRTEWENLNKQTSAAKPAVNNNEVIEEKNDVVEQNTAQEVVEQEEQVEETPVPDEKPVIKEYEAPKKQEDSYNFRRLRQQNEELERKIAVLESKLSQPASKEEDKIEEYDLKDDDITEGKHYKVLKTQVKKLNEALLKEKEEREKIAAEARLRAAYPDIFNVVTDANVEELTQKDPEFVRSIAHSPDQYAKFVSVYKMIKRLEIGKEDQYAKEKERAAKNLSKPRSSSTVSPRQGESTLAEADMFINGMTPEIQAKLLKEMDDAIANR